MINNICMCNKLFFLFLIICILSISTNTAQNSKKAQLQSQKSNIEKDIEATSKLIKETQKNSKKTTEQIKLLDNQVKNYESLISKINTEMALLDREIYNKKESIAKLKTELNILREQYSRMIYFAYLTRKPANRLVYLFSSHSIMIAWRRMNYFKEYSIIRKAQAAKIKEMSSVIEASLIELEEIRNEKSKLKSSQVKHKQELNLQKSEKDKIIKDLKKQEASLRSELKEKQKEASEIQRKIQAIIEAEIAASKKKTNVVNAGNISANKTKVNEYQMTPEETRISNTFAGNKGKMPWPVAQGTITDKFGEHPHPVLPDIKIKNNGIDISSPSGSNARAIYEGNVSAVISAPNGTSMIMIRHGEYLSVYSNINQVFVKKGENVTAKQNIGSVYKNDEGATILHFEIWKEKEPQNPESWISR